MKAAIVFCLFVLSYYEVMGTAQIEGNCTAQDIPRRIMTGCNNVHCTKGTNGTVVMSAVTCPLSPCPRNKKAKVSTPDMTKKFPACCPEVKCE